MLNLGGNMLTGPVPAAPPSGNAVLCPNPLDTSPSQYDADWNARTGHTPWWATPYDTNVCDDLFTSRFEL